jgi:hypothetical protein
LLTFTISPPGPTEPFPLQQRRIAIKYLPPNVKRREATVKRNLRASFFFMVVILAGMVAYRHGSMLFAQGSVNWITVRDTREQAFSIDVPRGWKSYGGMFRFSSVDARPFVDMTSPDGKTNVRVGDATIGGYATPNRLIPRGTPNVAPYAPGDVFSEKYGEARFAHMCQNIQVAQSHSMPPKYHQPGQGLIRTTGGETIFTCTSGGQAMAGYVYTETLLFGTGGPNSQWYVVALGSFIAPVSSAQAAGEILKHSGESLRLNPEWAKMQQALVDEKTREINDATRASIAYGNAERARQARIMGMQTQQNENFNDVINGVTFTRDPETGRTYEVQTLQGGQKWINGNNVVVSSALSPGASFRPLQTISR